MYTPRYTVEQGKLTVECFDEEGLCVDRTIYNKERFENEIDSLPASVVACYLHGEKESSSEGDQAGAAGAAKPAAAKKASKAAAKKAASKTASKR